MAEKHDIVEQLSDDGEEMSQFDLSFQMAAIVEAKQYNKGSIAELQELLSNMQKHLAKQKEHNSELVLRLDRLVVNSMADEEEKARTRVHVDALGKRLTKAIEENVEIKRKCRLKQQGLDEMKKSLTECRKKMKSYTVSVEESENNDPTISKLIEAKKRAESLKEMKASLDKESEELLAKAGSKDMTLDSIIDENQELEKTVYKLEKELSKFQMNLAEKAEEREAIETTNKIRSNRNSAMLTRLKKRVEAQKSQNDDLIEHIKVAERRLQVSKERLQNLQQSFY